MTKAEALYRASRKLSEANHLLLHAGFSEYSSMVQNIREVNGNLLLQVELAEKRGELTREQKLAAAMDAALGDIQS